MSLEIHQPEIEALIHQRMASGAFHDAEELLIYALKSAPPSTPAGPQPGFGRRLVEVCAMVKGLTEDMDPGRDPASEWRPLDLS